MIERTSGEDVVVAMNFDGVVRGRPMPEGLLDYLQKMIAQLREETKKALAGKTDVPLYPGFRSIMRGRLNGICHAVSGAHRQENGAVEQVIGVYDDGDEDSPVFVLVEEQIDEFVTRAQETLKAG